MEPETRDWNDYWRGLRERRVIAAVALVAFVPLWIALGALGLLLGFGLAFAAYWYLRDWRCPRCHLPIVGARFRTFPLRCVCCGLLVFGHVLDIQQPATLDPDAFVLPAARRRFVAWYQLLAATALILISPFLGGTWWEVLMMETLGALSCAAGLWLLRDEGRGYTLTRMLQFLQLVQLQSPWFTFAAMSGVGIELTDIEGGITVGPAFQAKFQLLAMPGLSFGVAVNLWSALLLLVLLQAKPRPRTHAADPDAPEGMGSSDASVEVIAGSDDRLPQ
ncbi:MAG: hypothetical protein JWO05_1055 [Gemmatimonadetes bacterium]|nr:hypothetical protein [Gemmatimonadota bacterium]